MVRRIARPAENVSADRVRDGRRRWALPRWRVMIKHFLFASLFPATLWAQSMELTQQLGKTVLYSDIAISADGNRIAWVQSTAATTTKETYLLATSAQGKPTKVNLSGTGERKD